jgi:hypothetical protein
MGMLGPTKISDGNDNVVATGTDGNDDDSKTLQVVIDEDNGLVEGGFYTITKNDGSGYRSICYTGPRAGFAQFAYETANKFSPGAG